MDNYKITKGGIDEQKLELYKKKTRKKMHSFHRYYGKLIPAIPQYFITEYTEEGDTVFDPFTGSGTTAVEAVSSNRNYIGTEINPLSVMIAKTKTAKLNINQLNLYNTKLLEKIDKLKESGYTAQKDSPFVINREHWFKPSVQSDLLLITEVIEGNVLENEYIEFYLTILSAIIRNVSNADNQHVFPGISKRMRRLESEGKVNIDVIASFRRAVIKRSSYYSIYDNTKVTECCILNESITSIDLSKYKNKVDIIVTNPPYISSVRYIETLKLELYWMSFLTSQDEYTALSKKMIGNDRLLKNEYSNISLTKYNAINDSIKKMVDIDHKSAKIIENFFNDIEKTIRQMNSVLKMNKKAIIKISDSKMKKEKIETAFLMNEIAMRNGFKIVDVFLDEINPNSRSLMTSRNTYSDIITHDYILIWEKIEEIDE